MTGSFLIWLRDARQMTFRQYVWDIIIMKKCFASSVTFKPASPGCSKSDFQGTDHFSFLSLFHWTDLSRLHSFSRHPIGWLPKLCRNKVNSTLSRIYFTGTFLLCSCLLHHFTCTRKFYLMKINLRENSLKLDNTDKFYISYGL